MKKEDLIKELQKLPDGIEICVFDQKQKIQRKQVQKMKEWKQVERAHEQPVQTL